MVLIARLLANGFVPLLPILLWNAVFARRLPAIYRPPFFDADLPPFLIIGENISRSLVFLMPVFLQTDVSASAGRWGLAVYAAGVILYFSAWLMLILAPKSAWSRSLPGQAAPAYLPLIWLIGLSQMFGGYYFQVRYSPWQFLAPAAVFLGFHNCHAFYVLLRANNRPSKQGA
jgi:hypothetical protein